MTAPQNGTARPRPGPCPAAALLLLATVAPSQWAPSTANFTVQRLGLFGPQQTFPNGWQVTHLVATNSSSHAIGWSEEQNLSTTGHAAWFWNGATNSWLGLTGPAYVGTNGLRYSQPVRLTDSGLVGGHSTRIGALNQAAGQDAWIWNGSSMQQVGFFGAAHTSTTGFRASSLHDLDDAGRACGSSWRPNGQNTLFALDAWYWDGTAAVRLGFTGPGYTSSAGGESSEAERLGSGGVVLGWSSRRTAAGIPNGSDAWLWDGTTTHLLGLQGAAHTGNQGYRRSVATLFAASGRVAGHAERIAFANTVVGQDAWLWDGAAVRLLGDTGATHTGPGGERHSAAVAMNDLGLVAGWSRRYGPLGEDFGRDAWRRDGTNTLALGLTGAVYMFAGRQASEPSHLSPTGVVAGTTARFDASGGSLGHDAWVWNGTSTVPIGLVGPGYETPAGHRETTVRAIGPGGGVAGESTRINASGFSIGSDGWYFDPATATTHRILAGVPNSMHPTTGFSQAVVHSVTTDGFVLGVYQYQPAGGPAQARAFAYRPDFGFTELAALATGGLVSQGWSGLREARATTTLQHVFGIGFVAGQTGGQSVFRMVPDPALAAAHTVYGAGCGGLSLAASPPPTLGSTSTYTTGNLPPNTLLAVQLVSLGAIDPGIDLGPLGAPGCWQSVDLATSATVVVVGQPTANHVLSIPNHAGWLGLALATQSAALVPGANALSLLSSNALRSVVQWY